MPLVSLGDLAQSTMLRRNMGLIKTQMDVLSQEMATGVSADVTRKTAADLGPLHALDNRLAQLEGFYAATTELELMAAGQQAALGVIDGFATTLAPQLLSAAAGSQPGSLSAIGDDGEQKFKAAIAALNTRAGDRSLFAGMATDRSPLPDGETILQALETAIGTLATAEDVRLAVSAWFDDPAGFGALYQGQGVLAPVAISQGETAELTVTAQSDGIRETLKGFAMAALVDRNQPGPALEGRAQLAKLAGQQLLNSQSARSEVAARLGVAEQQIAAAQSRNSAESTALEIARSKIVAVDPMETASRLDEASTQLELIYAITARMSRMTLSDYL